jgi:hypothetical protein
MTVSAFETSISASNGYVNSISRSIGIDKLVLIIEKYPNLDILWLLTGKDDLNNSVSDPGVNYNEACSRCADKDTIISLLKEKIAYLEKALVDKNSNYSQTD